LPVRVDGRAEPSVHNRACPCVQRGLLLLREGRAVALVRFREAAVGAES
jgi:hypothetical protein